MFAHELRNDIMEKTRAALWKITAALPGQDTGEFQAEIDQLHRTLNAMQEMMQGFEQIEQRIAWTERFARHANGAV